MDKYNAIVGPLSEKLAMECAILNMSGRIDHIVRFDLILNSPIRLSAVLPWRSTKHTHYTTA